MPQLVRAFDVHLAPFNALKLQVMTREEAKERIALSRSQLERCRRTNEIYPWPLEDLPLLEEEIAVLQKVADRFPGEVDEILRLVGDWVSLRDSLRTRLN